MRKKKILSIFNPFDELASRKVLRANPTLPPTRKEPPQSIITVFDYTPDEVKIHHFNRAEDCYSFLHNSRVSWINIDGLKKSDIDNICNYFGVHPLIAEDIFSSGQRPKMDELNQLLYSLLYMLFYDNNQVQAEQVSIILGHNFVLSFQEDASRDLFDPLREKLQVAGSKLRLSGADYLYYSLIDLIVDKYFVMMETLGEKIEGLEDDITHRPDTRTLAKINYLRKEMMFLKRTVSPVREMINGILRSENELINERTEKYFKDVYDHIIQANELAENYRDMMINLQDLYLSNVNLRMNEVMKVMAVVTCLLAPATVIGGIFGMNFSGIPLIHNAAGFYIAVAIMLIVPMLMIWIFKRRGWF